MVDEKKLLGVCMDCIHYEQTEKGRCGGIYGRCKIRYSRTDKAGGRQGRCKTCKLFEPLERS